MKEENCIKKGMKKIEKLEEVLVIMQIKYYGKN